jgi:GNAT superfamily N-acetyltransferase
VNAVAPAPAYTVAPADPARDREAVLAVWRGNLGRDERMGAKYDWFYRGCPLGGPLTLLLRDGKGEAVGVATAGPRRLRAGGREIRAGVLVDLAVLPEHRTLGPALILQQALIDAARERFELLYGLPNRRAVPVFKRVGYAPIGELRRFARVLRHRDYLARKLPAPLAAVAAPLVDTGLRLRDAGRRRADPPLRATWSDTPPAALPAAPDDALLRGVHDATFQRWRFADGPTPPARWLLLHGADGAPAGWFATQQAADMLHVVDAGGSADEAGPSRMAIDALLHAAYARGVASVSVQLAAPAALAAPWQAAGFVERDLRVVYGRWLAAGDPPPGLLMTAADEDE